MIAFIRNNSLTALLFFFTTISMPATAQVSPGKVDALFAKFSNSQEPGCAVLVIKDGKAVFRKGYGVTDLRSRQPIGPETNFRLASLTKQFTAMAIMLLVHDGKLKYGDHLTDVFPDFPAYGRAITIRQLLNHTSGLLDYEDILEKQYPGIPDEKIPQIKDAGVLDLFETPIYDQVSAGHALGLQQLRLRLAGDGGGEKVRNGLRRLSSRTHLQSARHEPHRRLREGKETKLLTAPTGTP